VEGSPDGSPRWRGPAPPGSRCLAVRPQWRGGIREEHILPYRVSRAFATTNGPYASSGTHGNGLAKDIGDRGELLLRIVAPHQLTPHDGDDVGHDQGPRLDALVLGHMYDNRFAVAPGADALTTTTMGSQSSQRTDPHSQQDDL
jgi:hypothetical protein